MQDRRFYTSSSSLVVLAAAACLFACEAASTPDPPGRDELDRRRGDGGSRSAWQLGGHVDSQRGQEGWTTQTESVGGGGGVAFTLLCPPGHVVVGLQGGAGAIVDRVSAVCAPIGRVVAGHTIEPPFPGESDSARRSNDVTWSYLGVASSPRANVYVDGAPIGERTPLERWRLEPGEHEVRLEYQPGVFSETKTVDLHPGVNTNVFFRQQPPAP